MSHFNPYKELKEVARKYAQAVRCRKEVNSGTYPKKATNLDGLELESQIRAAAQLGYYTELRVSDHTITVYFVEKLPRVPYELQGGLGRRKQHPEMEG